MIRGPRPKQFSDLDNQNVQASINDIVSIGSDGKPNFTISSNANPMGGQGGPDIVYSTNTVVNGVVEANNITIESGVTVTCDQERLIHFKCRGDFTNNGILDVSGKGYAGGIWDTVANSPTKGGCSVGGAGGGGGGSIDNTGQTGAPGIDRVSIFGGDGAEFSDAGLGALATESGTNAATLSLLRPAWVSDFSVISPAQICPGGGGGSGGAGGDNTNATSGGAGGGIIIIEALGNLSLGTTRADGTVGSDGLDGGSTDNGGGGGGAGGGGGGMIIIMYGGVLTGTPTVNGGAGGAGGAGAGTSPGDGGSGATGEDGIIRIRKVFI